MRASYYNQRAKLGFKGSPRRDSRALSAEDAIEEAKRLLERALERIDEEVEAAKSAMEAAEAQLRDAEGLRRRTQSRAGAEDRRALDN